MSVTTERPAAGSMPDTTVVESSFSAVIHAPIEKDYVEDIADPDHLRLVSDADRSPLRAARRSTWSGI